MAVSVYLYTNKGVLIHSVFQSAFFFFIITNPKKCVEQGRFGLYRSALLHPGRGENNEKSSAYWHADHKVGIGSIDMLCDLFFEGKTGDTFLFGAGGFMVRAK
jgi:hypothetical protein